MIVAEMDAKPNIVIVGAGFGGLSCAKGLLGAQANVTLVDAHNYHLFQPLLYQVATAALSPEDIASPIRAILRNHKNTKVLLDTVEGVDTEYSQVQLKSGAVLPYDYLVLATGARYFYFGHEEWSDYAPGLKNIDDAIYLRKRILLAFERAEVEKDSSRRAARMTFTIVGAGPTGVELAGALAELARHSLASDFRNISPSSARIILVEAGDRVLSAFPESLARKAHRALEKLGVEIMTGVGAQAIDAEGIDVAGERIACDTVIWAAGVQASLAGQWINTEMDRGGRVIVEKDCSVSAYPNIYAIGDTALYRLGNGDVLPGVAPVAKQQGQYLAKLLKAKLKQQASLPKFHYRDYGNLATIGRKAAIADFKWLRISGFIAWVIWSLAHVYFLIGFRRRLIVALNWFWQYLTFRRGARLITGDVKPER